MKFRDKENKRKDSIISTPILVYLFILVILIILAILGLKDKTKILENLFYGVAGSTVVSLLIDIGNTSREKRIEKNVYIRVTSLLRARSEKLFDNIILLSKRLEIDDGIVDKDEEVETVSRLILRALDELDEIHGNTDKNEVMIFKSKLFISKVSEMLRDIEDEAEKVYYFSRGKESKLYNPKFLMDIEKMSMKARTIVDYLELYKQGISKRVFNNNKDKLEKELISLNQVFKNIEWISNI